MTKEEFITAVARLVSGLQVPVSMPGFYRAMGTGAGEPWQELCTAVNGGFGWTNQQECEAKFREILSADG